MVNLHCRMTEQERKLVVEYINLDTIAAFVFRSEIPRFKKEMIERYYNTYGFRFYLINHLWKEVIKELKKEAYRRWINFVVKSK